MLQVQLEGLQSGGTWIFPSSHCWQDLPPLLPLPKASQTHQFRDCLVKSPLALLEHFPKHPTKLPVQNQSSHIITGTKVLKHNHFESDSVGKRAAAWGTYLHNAQRSWCDRIWEVATWGRDTEQEDRRRNSQNHCHGLNWSTKHVTTQVSDHRNKQG